MKWASHHRWPCRLLRLCLLLIATAYPAWGAAQEDPSVRMGRLSLLVGKVEAQVEDGAQWIPAVLNLPLSSMSRVRTAAQSRAEVRVGSVVVHVDADTMLVLRAVDDNQLVFVLFRGSAGLSVPGLAAGQRISMQANPGPADRAAALVVGAAPATAGPGAGRFHFTRHATGPGFDMRVLEGQGEVVGTTPTLALPAGRQVVVNVTDRTVGEPGDAKETPFTEWARQRAQRRPDAQTLRHVSAEMTGAEELDKHGSWTVDARWGALWIPAGVDADWAPYRQGRWLATQRRGWAWVDDAPWGFAPFHYGRWLFVAGRWAWSPGARVERPIYAPALVGFYGNAAGASDWVGWFPLAPGEAYRPAFKARPEFVQNLNAPAFERLVSEGYRHANTLFAATAMSRDAFVAGQATTAAAVRLTASMLLSAGVLDLHAPPMLVPSPSPNPPPGAAREVSPAGR